ncbi:MAG: tetratricopeptide repeat protein [Deltaproteobacteria bacterium]|nr:tetratricopeptide repeat protein [Deltaproteobacteria bacterium]
MSSSAIPSRLLILLALLVSAVPAFAQRPNQGEDESAALVAEGRAALKQNKLDQAANALDQAIALNPRRVEAYVLRSAVHAAKKQYKEGIELMRRAQALSPTDEEVLTALGSQLVLSGDVGGGIPILEEVTKKNALRYDAQLLLGHHWHATGKWPDAIVALEAYFKHRPEVLAKEDARHRVDLADSYLRYRQPAKALTMFRQASDARATDLRAKIGVAWATAAVDCRKARPLLKELEPIATDHPEVWLVDGLCALALGDTGGALALGRKYLEKAPQASAAGHALVGEAHAARGNLGAARKELETARQLEPTRRRWSVRFAVVLRRSGDPKSALATLESLGPPAAPSIDPDWWSELGEALIAAGDPQAAATRLVSVLPELPGDVTVRTVAGAALLLVGQGDAAIKTLSEAEAIISMPRSRKLLSEALTLVAVKKLSANDAAAAEPMLSRAEQLEGNALVWRNLGIARLALNKPAEAVTALDRAIKAEPSGITLMLAGRAHAAAGDLTGARTLYERALATEKDNIVEVALDWAATEVGSGDPAIAIAALEKTSGAARGGPLAGRHKAALAIARHAAGLVALRGGNGAKAVEHLAASAKAVPDLSTKCDLALAAVVVGDAGPALAALRAVSGQACPFPPPADAQAAPILIAFTEGRNPRRAGKALDKLTSLAGKSSGPAAVLLNTSIRVVALEAAQDAYRNGQLAQARKYLTSAKNVNSRVGVDELAHNLAVIDLAEGKLDTAIAGLERIAPKLPEALINLGIAYERKGDPTKALDAWRRARKAGARFGPLTDWIESKERIYGGAP